ncbi:hypothetical protein PVAG01_01595 [Phlyctema vagabunda]|uniref:Uncharacterized protein n=1 Tax=Phlyctema vagabunda TaxID=108571 RepID=A0ABR4PXL8_9HELO
MSRNIRHKSIGTPSKKTVRRSSRATDTSDDDYAGVDLISDSEESEPDVEVAEEQAIIASEEEDDDVLTPRPSIDDDQSSWEGFDVASQDDVLGGDEPFFDDHMARMTKPDVDTQITAWNATNVHSEDDNTPEARRVRFDIDSDSSSSHSEDEDNIFPDIFLDQNSLDPSFRRIIENGDDNDDDLASSNDGSYWDFRGSDGEDAADGSDDNAGNQSESSIASSGYETDEGETTEEDLPLAAKYIPSRKLRGSHSSSDSSSSEEDITVIRNAHKHISNRGPKLGSWVHDRTKPFVLLDSHGKNLLIFKAQTRRYSFNGTNSQPTAGFLPDFDPETPGGEQISPMMSDPANLMMSAFFSTAIDNSILSGHALGPPEAFHPFTSVATDGTVSQDSPSSYDEEEVDDEDLWDLDDFVKFDEASSADEGDAEDDERVRNENRDPMSSTPARPTTATSEDNQEHPLLNHLNGGLVGAFRRNQTRHQLLIRNTATRDSLAFSGPYRQGTLRGIKKGSLAAANTPITPMRKQKTAKPALLPSSPGSPLAAAANAAQKKRKFSGEARSHKRSRSMI